MIPFLALLLASPIAAGLPPSAPDSAVSTAHAAPGFDLAANNMAALTPDDVKPEEYGKWHGSVSLGAMVADGNTDRVTVSATGKAVNRREKDRKTLELLWNYVGEEDEASQHRTLALAKYDYFVSQKLYYLGQLSGEEDKNARLDLRAILAAGAGYQFREDETWKLAGEAGLAYVEENYFDSDSDAEYLAARLAEKADYKPNDKWVFGHAGEFIPSLEDSDDMSARLDTNAKVTLSEKLFAQLQWIYTWDNTPASGADHVDNLFLLTLGWSF